MSLSENNKSTILISGAFNPLHLGHLLLLKHASSYGEVIVALNSDMWIKKNKGYLLFNYETRKMFLEDFPYVSKVIDFDDSDGTVCDAIRKVKPTFFGNGGTVKDSSIPEAEYQLCKELDIVTVFGLGENEDMIEEKYLVLTQDSILRHAINELDKLDKFREIHQQQ
jgi:D-beta-D-heptose 7-phosphate kinase/D-beta-D-heptose 1-phosphate adenosyltransferase